MPIVGLDSTFVSILLNPKAAAPRDPRTGIVVDAARKRAEHALSMVQKDRGKIIVPTPVVAEILTAIGANAQIYFEIIGRNRLFEVAPFDERAAIELVFLNRSVFQQNDLKNQYEAYQKIKVDRQILATLKSRGATIIYTDDSALSIRARLCGIEPIQIADLELPPEEKQGVLRFEPHEPIPPTENEPQSE